jgi:DNA-binding transcriptional ArsR family regulator
MSEISNGGPRQYFVMFPAHLVLELKGNPLSQVILLYAIWRKELETKHADGKWHFRISEIARTLGKQEKTIRKHLKPLLEMGLLYLTGNEGNEYYLFSEKRYEELLTLDPSKLISDFPTKTRPPYQDLGAPPLPKIGTSPFPKNGTLKKKEESIKKQSRSVLSCTVQPDGTEQEAKLETCLSACHTWAV